MNDNTILITGINGQLGQFLADYIIKNQPHLQIIGTIRQKSYSEQPWMFDKSKVIFETMDLSDSSSITNLILKYKPTYMVNTAAAAFVGASWAEPHKYLQVNCDAVVTMLEAIAKHSNHTRFLNMGTSEEFGTTSECLINESTTLHAKSPYGASKIAARQFLNVYRESYNLYAVQNWSFNFESELRGIQYVTKKIIAGVARIKKAIDANHTFEPIMLGNVDSIRSWQFAGDVADAVWRSLNQDSYNINYSGKPKDYVVCAPKCHSVREFIHAAFDSVGIITVNNQAGEFKMVSVCNQPIYLTKIDPKFFRPNDLTFLNGDASLISSELGWKSTLSFGQLVNRMIKYELTAGTTNQ